MAVHSRVFAVLPSALPSVVSTSVGQAMRGRFALAPQ